MCSWNATAVPQIELVSIWNTNGSNKGLPGSTPMKLLEEIPLSILDLSPIVEGGTAAESLRHSLDLAQHAEQWGYRRFWVAEHHNMPGVASTATAVLIAYIAGGTSTIRVGSGGVMLPNHSPLVIAEQFGTLESLYPDRIDLGLGRAPGTDQRTARALRRNSGSSGDTFPQDLMELMSYFRGDDPNAVRAVPAIGLEIPIWLLGSSTFSATLAAELGLPFAFASHFAPDQLFEAIETYRDRFKPSPTLAQPYLMVGVNIFASDTDEEARRLMTSLQQVFLSLVRGAPKPLQPPVDTMDDLWSPEERSYISRMTRVSAVGRPERVRSLLDSILAQTDADELILTSHVFDHAARLRSFEIAAEVQRNNPVQH